MTTWQVALRKRLQHGSSRFDLDVSFSCADQRVVLFGPSGAGKTQTLRLIAGVAAPDAGQLSIAGRLLYDHAQAVSLSPQDRQLAYVFQDYALFPHLTVRQNIAFARHRGWRNPGRQTSDPRVDLWIDRFHLQGVAGHYPHQLSGGQRQRTALARALVNDPAALLLDEPFAALDKGLRQNLREELLELQVSLNIPLLLITHDDDDVRCIAERVVHLEAGRVVHQASDGALQPQAAT